MDNKKIRIRISSIDVCRSRQNKYLSALQNRFSFSAAVTLIFNMFDIHKWNMITKATVYFSFISLDF